MFSDDDGATAWKPNRVTKAFGRYRKTFGLRSFRLHDLRHFMATEMLGAAVPIVTVSRRLDHHRVSTTRAWTGNTASHSALIQNIRRGNYELGAETTPQFRLMKAFDELAEVI